MNRKGLALKFFLPVALSLAALLGVVIWGVSAYQTGQTEQAFEEQLTSLAVASRSMFHADAEDYCRSRGLDFHRVREGQYTGDRAAEAFERTSLAFFASNPASEQRVLTYTDAKGEPRIYVLSPAGTRTPASSATPPSALRPSRAAPPASWWRPSGSPSPRPASTAPSATSGSSPFSAGRPCCS